MHAAAAAREWLKDQVRYLDIATKALSFQIWPKQLNRDWVTGKEKPAYYS